MSAPWIELSRDDFLEAIKRLKPGRMLKSYQTKELQIGLDGEEAIFCIEGATPRRPAQGSWHGFACISYGLLLPYLKVKPEAERVRLVFDQGRLKIGTARFQARWIDTSPWISRMALEAHFFGPATPPGPKLYCPRCGKRQGVARDDIEQKAKRSLQEDKFLIHLERIGASHGCGSCSHAWKEIQAGHLLSFVDPVGGPNAKTR